LQILLDLITLFLQLVISMLLCYQSSHFKEFSFALNMSKIHLDFK